jgi:hypothetical protein
MFISNIRKRSKDMRKFILFAVIASVLALTASTVYAAPPPNGPPGLEQAIAVQEAHNPQLLRIPGVVGTAVGLASDGNPTIKIFLERSGVAGVPTSLDGIPIEIQVTGKIAALKPGQGPPSGKGPKQREPSSTDRWPRPVPIGISTGNRYECSAGTIGARVKDVSGNVYALSNNHVYAREDSASLGEEVLQPGLFDTGCVYDPDNHLGNLFAFVPLEFDGSANYVDAAIALTSTDYLDNTTPKSGYGIPKSSTADATLGMLVQKFGRTTQLTKGVVTGLNGTGWISYDSGLALFADQIIIESAKKPFVKAGDSGSLIVTQGGRQPVGLLFAGDSSGKFAIANQIDLVLSAFGVTIDGN